MKDNILILPDGNLAFFSFQHEEAQTQKLVEFEKTEKINTAFLKIIHKLPEGCLSISCLEKLTQSYPMLPFSCANCSNHPTLILKAGFYTHPLPLCENCDVTECTKLQPIQRMRKILFQRCKLLEK